MSRKVALITGITGQDGSYLARLLLEKGYEVHGIKRRSSSFNTARIDDIYVDPREHATRFFLHHGDMIDATSLIRLVQKIKPDEIYNLAAQSHVQVSFETPEYTADADALGTLRLLEALRILGMTKTRFYQASTSELYGKVQETPQRETTPFYPRSPYAAAKLYAFWITVNYREAYGLHASNGILFNHESPVRGETFVTRKITRAVAAIQHGQQDCLYLGNIDSMRDWGHARDYVEGMWRMLQLDEPDDFVLATGEMHSVREFIELAFARVGRKIAWSGKGVDEVGRDRRTGKVLVRIDPFYFRPTEVDLLLGDPSKAHEKLGWRHTTKFVDLVNEMVDADMHLTGLETQSNTVETADAVRAIVAGRTPSQPVPQPRRKSKAGQRPAATGSRRKPANGAHASNGAAVAKPAKGSASRRAAASSIKASPTLSQPMPAERGETQSDAASARTHNGGRSEGSSATKRVRKSAARHRTLN